MSRVGKKPIAIPSGVTVTIGDEALEVKGPKGTLSTPIPNGVKFTQEEGTLVAERSNDDQAAFHGLARALANNAVVGVTEGFRKDLEIVGVGYRATAQGAAKVELSLGFSHTVSVDAPDGITFEVPVPTQIVVNGIDKEVVGQVAADIRSIRKPEPYKGKGVRYAGERVLRKAGKAGKK